MGDADDAVGEDVHRGFARDAALLGEQHAFGKGQHLHGEAQVGGDLHHQRQAVVADVGDFRADVEQQRLDALEGFRAAADHDRELSLLQRDDAAGDGRIHHVGAFFADSRGERAAYGGAHGAHVDPDFAGAESGHDSVRSFGNLLQRGGIRDHGKREVGFRRVLQKGNQPRRNAHHLAGATSVY